MCQDCVAVLDIVELAQDRFCGPADSVLIQPLQVANPHHHGRKLLRVDVGFQAVKLRGVNLFIEEGGEPVLCGKYAGILPQIEHSPKRDIQEVSTATGRIEYAD